MQRISWLSRVGILAPGVLLCSCGDGPETTSASLPTVSASASEQPPGDGTATADTPTEGTPTDPTDADSDTGIDPDSDTDGDTGEPFPGCEGIDLEQSGVLDVDIPAVAYVVLSGAVSVNGGALPNAAGSRGAIAFEYTPVHGAPGVATYALGDAGPESYQVLVPAGTVTVRYLPDAALCGADLDGPMPCTGGLLFTDLAVEQTGVLDLDIPSVTVSGVVTQNGGEMPDAAADRGHLELSDAAGGALATPGFATTGAPDYAVAVFPGTYAISFVGNPALCSEGAAEVACNRGVVLPAVAIASTGVLDVDVPAVQVAGKVTVNGKAVPDGDVDRGALRLRPADGGAGELLTAPFAAAGPVAYALTVVAGSYDIDFVANPALCDDETPPLPCVGGPLRSAVALTSDGVLDVDVPRIAVSGAITLDGAPLPDQPGPRGSLRLARGDADGATLELGDTGPRTYALGLLAGTYTIHYAANSGLCDGLEAPKMPCTGGPLKTLELTHDGVLDLDLRAVQVAGNITLAGGPLPDQPMDRGAVVFTGGPGQAVSIPLGGDGPRDYAITVLAGGHGVAYVAADGCVAAADGAMPCGGGELLADVALVSDGVLDLDIPAIDISGAVTYKKAALPDLDAARGALRWTRLDGSGALELDLEAAGPRTYAVTLMPGPWVLTHVANPALCADGPPKFPCTDQVVLGCPQ